LSGSKSVIFYAAIILSLLILSCANGLPELNPYKEASSAPGVEWKPSEKELAKSFQLEELPEIPEDLKPDSNKLALSQLVDVALINNPLRRWPGRMREPQLPPGLKRGDSTIPK
jgi:hypothetical protein